MDIRVLNYFLTIVNEKSITAAAKKLCMAPPPLSRQMKKLEEDSGIKIFIRSSNKLQLTKEGLLFLEEVKILLHAYDVFYKEVAALASTNDNILNIGSSGIISTFLTPELIHNFNDEYKNIRVALSDDTVDNVLAELYKGHHDIVFVRTPVNINAEYVQKIVSRDHWAVFMSIKHQLANSRLIGKKDLKGYGLILPIRPMLRETIVEHLSLQMEQVVQYYLNPISAFRILDNSPLLMLAPEMCKEYMGEDIVCRRIDDFIETTDILCVYAKTQKRVPKINKFLKAVDMGI